MVHNIKNENDQFGIFLFRFHLSSLVIVAVLFRVCPVTGARSSFLCFVGNSTVLETLNPDLVLCGGGGIHCVAD
jgi:hypothetical protein